MAHVPQLSSLCDALCLRIENDVVLKDMLKGDKIYNGLAPKSKNKDFPYITISDLTDVEYAMFMSGTSEAQVTLQAWSSGPRGMKDVLAIYDRLALIFSGKKLALANGKVFYGRMSLVLAGAGDFIDASIYRSASQYTARMVSNG